MIRDYFRRAALRSMARRLPTTPIPASGTVLLILLAMALVHVNELASPIIITCHAEKAVGVAGSPPPQQPRAVFAAFGNKDWRLLSGYVARVDFETGALTMNTSWSLAGAAMTARVNASAGTVTAYALVGDDAGHFWNIDLRSHRAKALSTVEHGYPSAVHCPRNGNRSRGGGSNAHANRQPTTTTTTSRSITTTTSSSTGMKLTDAMSSKISRPELRIGSVNARACYGVDFGTSTSDESLAKTGATPVTSAAARAIPTQTAASTGGDKKRQRMQRRQQQPSTAIRISRGKETVPRAVSLDPISGKSGEVVSLKGYDGYTLDASAFDEEASLLHVILVKLGQTATRQRTVEEATASRRNYSSAAGTFATATDTWQKGTTIDAQSVRSGSTSANTEFKSDQRLVTIDVQGGTILASQTVPSNLGGPMTVDSQHGLITAGGHCGIGALNWRTGVETCLHAPLYGVPAPYGAVARDGWLALSMILPSPSPDVLLLFDLGGRTTVGSAMAQGAASYGAMLKHNVTLPIYAQAVEFMP